MPVIPAGSSEGPLSQNTRIGKLHTPLGKDRLVLKRFSGVEGINELFAFEVEAIAVKKNIDFDALLGKNVTVEVATIDPAHPPRFFDGLLAGASWTGLADGANGYRMTLRPWLWLLTLRRNQRIFHNKTAPNILQEVFADYGFEHETLLSGSYPTLEYTVQYGETDFDFVCRIMERFGINYSFSHQSGGHKLVLCDENDAWPPIPGGSREFFEMERQHLRSAEHLTDWHANRQMTTGQVTLTDYDFKVPGKGLDADQAGSPGHAHEWLESFEYPGLYLEKDEGKQLSKLRLAQKRAADRHHTARGDAVSLAAGMIVKVLKHPDKTINNQDFLAIRCQHQFEAESYASGGGGGGGESYRGAYEFVPLKHTMAPEVRTPQSRIQGPQTATVVGEGEIDCDEHGRILVKFHWDRHAAHSMRCRVAQIWAGKGWGGMTIPRVGMEVVVVFIDGDPDQPLIVGCVYNGANKPPYELPGKKNLAGIKSASTPGSGGYNEIVFDDTDGDELFRQHAQYDMETKVLNDERREVQRDRETKILKNDTLQIGENLKTEVTEKEDHTVGKDRKTGIGKNDTLEVGQTLEIKAGQKIKLSVGGSSIEMDATGVTIKAVKVEVKASGQLGLNGTMTDLKGSATVTIKGGMVMIN